jgi:decaprenyl-phosphate phosphoribosyltransferase
VKSFSRRRRTYASLRYVPLIGGLDINSLEALASNEQVPIRFEERVHAPVGPGRAARLSAPALVRACRPRQWSKNLLVLAAPCAAGVILRPQVAAQVAGAFVALCLMASATYLINDVRDREQDRLHPSKRSRPVAAGELSPRAALLSAAAMALLGLALATAIAPGLGAVVCGYLALTASYSLLWRRVVVADILAIAAGFVLRALAGGVATDIYLSRWFVIVTACCAIFLVTAKRYAELREHAGSRPTRATLRRYSAGSLRLTLVAAATIAGIAYISWAFTRPSHLVLYAASIAPFLLWLARYARLIGAGAGQAPEELILRDRTLLALSVAWTLLFLGGVYAGG